mgnify:FL=1|jgi:catechol 2,3-dioxygenase-like lactoylglutathione lyase family enzyme
MNLNQVTVPSRDLQRSVAFYEALGLRLIVSSLPRYVRFELPEGEGTFSVHLVEALPQGQGVVVYFECQNLDQDVDRLLAAGIRFDTLPQDQPWLWREASLRDPDGNSLILFQAGANRKNPPWRLQTSVEQ